jgi:osmotically-inducible protein OsmY
MKNSIVLLGALALVAACSRDKAPESGSTTVTGATTGEAKPVTVEEVRVAILDQNPAGSEALSSVVIMSENNAITLKGSVPDEATHASMVDRVRRMPNVKSVRDELTVAPKTGSMQGTPGKPQAQPMDDPGKGNMPGQPQAQPMDDPGKGNMPGTTTTVTKTKKTDAIRSGMTKDNVAPVTIINGLIISDDGSVIMLRGIVPDEKTHDAVVKSAKKYAGGQTVQDNLTVPGK